MMQRTLDEALDEIEQSEAGPKIAAFFDFDGTLIYGYSALVFAQDRIMSRQVGLAEALRTARLGIDYARGKAGYDDLIKLAGSTWKGKTTKDIEALGERLFKQHIADRVYPEARALVAAHRKRGHTIAITTSATWFQVAPIAKALGIPEVVCQHLEIVDDIVTGNMSGASMWGSGKARAARSFATEHDVNFDASFFYADGDEDAALMSEIGNPRPTNPGKHLAAVAEERGWPILRFEPRGTPSPDVIARNVTGMMMAGPIATGAALLGLARRSRREALNVTTSVVPDAMFGLAAVQLDIHGEHHLATTPSIVVWVQRSRIDAFVIAKLLRRNCTIIVERGLAADPVVGSIGRLFDVAFERNASDPDTALQHRAMEALAGGTTVAFGIGDLANLKSRNQSTTIRASITRLASQAGVSIIPIVIDGTDRLVTRRPPMIRPGIVRVEVLAPMTFECRTRADHEAAAEAITALMQAATNS
jgi:putative phosphoserine phosphatase / 1-acylglycerol-3-phosphate O-acyltransferase